MFIGRAFGWILVVSAIVMASGEAVMAIGTGTYQGLATGEIWALLWGQAPDFLDDGLSSGFWHFLGALFMEMPAWAIMGPLGVIVAHTCRRRPPPGRLFRTAY